jgi:hypothetical protein
MNQLEFQSDYKAMVQEYLDWRLAGNVTRGSATARAHGA